MEEHKIMSIKTDILDSLVSQLKSIRIDAGNSIDIRNVYLYAVPLTIGAESVPFVEIDEVRELYTIIDSDNYRGELKLLLTFYSNRNQADGSNVLSLFMNSLRSLIYSPITLTGYALDVRLLGWEKDMKSIAEGIQSITAEVDIVYYEPRENLPDETGTAFYGVEGHVLIPVSKVVDQLKLLQTAIEVGYYPTISAVYDSHSTASCLKNAVSVDIETIDEKDYGTLSAGVDVDYGANVSIRVHTGFAGSPFDSVMTNRLLNSIDNWLNTHKNLGSGYRIVSGASIKSRQVFAESNTIGGQINVKVGYLINHLQA
jgi:hypothetical protein